jgi:voltage-gated sodium channel
MRRFFFREKNMMIAIGLNAIVIFCLSFPQLSDAIFWVVLDDIFIVFFLAEAIVKISTLKFKNYWKNKWNKFDFIVAVGSLPLLFPALMTLTKTWI